MVSKFSGLDAQGQQIYFAKNMNYHYEEQCIIFIQKNNQEVGNQIKVGMQKPCISAPLLALAS